MTETKGKIWVVGLGPGAEDLRAPRAQAVLEAADDIIGYGPYVARVAIRPGQKLRGSDNREEVDRGLLALKLAKEGRKVAVVSSGDAGVFAMAAAVFEALEVAPRELQDVEIELVPGISAVLAAASRLGAPYGNDFCVISLSDNLKPFDVVLNRVEMAARAGFAMAFYNPISKSRPWQLGKVLDALRAILPADVPVMFATAVSRPEERIQRTTIGEAQADQADMRTLVMIGTEETRIIERDGYEPIIYTSRSVGKFGENGRTEKGLAV